MDEKEKISRKLQNNMKKYVDFLRSHSRIIIFLAVILIIGYFLYPFIKVTTPQFSSFKGNAEAFWFQGQNSDVDFKAYRIFLILTNTTDVSFNSVKNIRIEYSNGEKRTINHSYNIKIRHYKDQSMSISNVDIGLYFGNLTMTKRLDQTYLYGTISFIRSSGGKVDVDSSSVDDVSIGDEKVTNFNHIIFEMDKESSIWFSSEISELQATPVYDLNITSQLSKINILSQSEGVLNLDSHKFDIKGADYLYVELLPNYQIQPYLVVKDTKIIFGGDTNLAKLNNETKIMSEGYYWYNIKPEALFSEINAFAVVILVILTGWYAYSTKSMLTEQTKNRKIEAIEKKLEHVYSPINNSLNKFKLELEPFPSDTIPDTYNELFKNLNYELMEVHKNYGHLFDQDLLQYHHEVWDSWKQYSSRRILENYKNLNALINKFHALIGIKIREETKSLNNLQGK